MLGRPRPMRIDDAQGRGQVKLLGNRDGRRVLALLVVLVLASSAPASEPLQNVRVSWLGNSFPGAEKWVQQDIHAMAVAPDGRVYTNVEWDEAGRNVGVYKDGDVVGNALHTHGWGYEGGRAIAFNNRYLFIGQTASNEGGGLKDPEPKPRWTIVALYAKGSHGHESCEPMGFDIAGDYLFVPYTGAASERKFATGHIEVFRLADGAGVGHMEPSREVGEIGLQDIRECLRAHRRKDGSYLVLLEDDSKSKVLMYRWTP